MTPVTTARIKFAESRGIHNADTAAIACRLAGLPYYAACALLQKESNGRNVYGHDKGGALSGFPRAVNKENYEVFKWMVFDQQITSNGVGPCQLTYKGFFTDMEARGMRPYDVMDNMLYGFRLLWGYYSTKGESWAAAGSAYNGAASYGQDLEKKVHDWHAALKSV